MTSLLPEVLIAQVHYNSLSTHGEQCIRRSLAAARCQRGFVQGQNLSILLVDNASNDGTRELLMSLVEDGDVLVTLPENIGFCGGHNDGAFRFLNSSAKYYLLLNPDLRMEETCLQELVSALQEDLTAGSACPLLLRGDGNLKALYPEIIDAAGMILTPSLRHFDIGSGEPARMQTRGKSLVFGGSGACLLLSRDFVSSVSFRAESDTDVFDVFPQLERDYTRRTPLFDEAFFAYREDAELAWRGQLLGYRSWFVPGAVAIHRRVVTPEKRGELNAFINLLGVQNRFLLQGNCYFVRDSLRALFFGILIRNLVVLVAVVLVERSSLGAFINVYKLRRRMVARRSWLKKHRKSAILPLTT